ncbi:TIGR04211 family SH3 domain-containing protein [Shewanella avicenniae]|uniref:TIGR04211 family SH3 domain-containing protein n=1 Tax=Shewanella avicenniae TaxID=2814294 RepID=A0ABX7QXI2_9GAMM|nr:TIGR04211 family SH3 domain-containing protein [Shewanella avicenniae]
MLLLGALAFASVASAEEQAGYISDDIYIYIHGGPGNQFRILGSIEAGQPVTVTGETESDYSKIVDHKGREGWVKTEFLTTQQTLRFQVPELQNQLTEAQQQLQTAISDKANEPEQLSQLTAELAQVKQALAEVTHARDQAQQQLTAIHDDAQYKMWREGGIIAAIGALIAVILVYLPRPRSKKRDRWF